MKFLILGAGHWGIALANVLAYNKQEVLVWSKNIEEVDLINEKHLSKHFSLKLNKRILATNDLVDGIVDCEVILVALPTNVIENVLKNVKEHLNKKIVLVASKGLYKGETLYNLFQKEFHNCEFSLISGPSFAIEVMKKLPTAVVIAAEKYEIREKLQKAFNNNFFRVYTSSDIIGIEYCGALKNVYAIVCGMIDAHFKGSNTKNALISRALVEMGKLLEFAHGDKKTLLSLTGIGDLMLTANSMTSRNYRYGFYFPKSLDDKLGVAEGINTLEEIYQIAINNNIDMPIVFSLKRIIDKRSTIKEETIILMERNLKEEL